MILVAKTNYFPFIFFAVGPDDIVVRPLELLYNDGDELNCSSEGNPTPTFYWMDLSTGSRFEGPTLKLNFSLIGQHTAAVSCTATNMVLGALYLKSVKVELNVTQDQLSLLDGEFKGLEHQSDAARRAVMSPI